MPEADQPADDPQGKAAEAAGAGAAPESEPAPITFKSQAELDAIIEARVARAKPKDYDELVALRDKVKAGEEAEKSELQKEKDARAEDNRKASERVSKADAALIRAELLTEATAQKAADPSIVVALLQGALTVDDDGNVVGAKDAVKALLKEKPILVAGTSQSSGGAEFGGNDPQTVQEKITELERAGKFKEARELKLTLVKIG